MKDILTKEDVIAALFKMADDLTGQADQLRELDAAIGDGDLGITITIGFEAVRDALPSLADSDIGAILMKSGMAFNRKAASTFGALYATMMMRMAKVAKGLQEIGVAELAAMFEAAAQGVQDRGKAHLGVVRIGAQHAAVGGVIQPEAVISAGSGAGGGLKGKLDFGELIGCQGEIGRAHV